MIVIAQRDEAERLQNAFDSPYWIQHFGHAVYRTGLCLEGDLDKVTLPQGLAQSQEAAGDRDCLKPGFSALAVFQHDEGDNCAPQVDSRGALLWVRLGEVCHSRVHYVTASPRETGYGSACPNSKTINPAHYRNRLITKKIGLLMN